MGWTVLGMLTDALACCRMIAEASSAQTWFSQGLIDRQFSHVISQLDVWSGIASTTTWRRSSIFSCPELISRNRGSWKLLSWNQHQMRQDHPGWLSEIGNLDRVSPSTLPQNCNHLLTKAWDWAYRNRLLQLLEWKRFIPQCQFLNEYLGEFFI